MPTGISANAHAGTPTLQVLDARGLSVRTVQFHRRKAGDPIDTRVTQQRFDAVGRLLASRDPYLFDLALTDPSTPFNLSQVSSLSSAALLTDSVDAGWRVGLQGEAGHALEGWDGRGSHSLTEYDELLRPAAVREQGRGTAEHTLERFTYANTSAEAAAHNLCGQMIRHDDPAGTVHVHDLGLTGNMLSHTRHFLLGTGTPDWSVDVTDRDELLEPGAGATTLNAFAASGEPLSQTDALGNRQSFGYTVDGQLKSTRLTLAGAGQSEKLLVSGLQYNTNGKIEAEIAGNGVVTRHCYDAADGRLTELSAHKADGTALQRLKYHYDAGGNALRIEDTAQPIRYFNNQRLEAVKTYCYDTLDQLIHATGCEAKTGNGGPSLPNLPPIKPDPDQIANFTQTFFYDASGNLLKLVHVGAQAQGRTLTRARYSNRCLPEREGRLPTEVELANGFDANGNFRELQPGQWLSWNLRNQLREVRPVVREEAEDDGEHYVYGGDDQRLRKIRTWLTNARMLTSEVRYLPGVEIRTHGGTGEILHVISASAGSNGVQVLHWASKPPDEVPQDQVRYSLNDQVKSSTLELDQLANLISWEWYYAFGGTARWAGRNTIEAKYKTVRYSGKERDATRLYYYGFRFYAPWLQRWINADPAGPIDGLNLYRMVRNNPIALYDNDGLSPEEDLYRTILGSQSFLYLYNANPQDALARVHATQLERGYERELLDRVMERVRKEMSSTPTGTAPSQNRIPAARASQRTYEAEPAQRNIPSHFSENMHVFLAIYTTNIGSNTINSAMRAGSAPEKGIEKKVISEIKGMHGYSVFKHKVGEKNKSDIEYMAKNLTLEDIKTFSSLMYQQQLSQPENISIRYRGQSITTTGWSDFKKAHANSAVVQSSSLLSASTNKRTAERFMHGTKLLMEITGFSSYPTDTEYSPNYESEWAFSHEADFIVSGYRGPERAGDPYFIQLTEVRGHTGPRSRMPF